MTLIPQRKLPGAALEDLARSGLTPWDGVRMKIAWQSNQSAYRIPYFDLDGTSNGYYRDRFVNNPLPKGKGGKPLRYVGPEGKPPRLYLPPMTDWRKVARDPSVELLVTEGEKKAAAATKAAFPTIGLGGVWCWRSEKRPLPDLDLIEWKGRRAYIAFDSDAATNPKVQQAERALEAELHRRGADIRVVRLPPAKDGGKQGLDDYLVQYGGKALQALLDRAYQLKKESHDESERGFTFAELETTDFPRPRWAVEGLIAEGLAILGGPRKAGKSSFTRQLAVAKADGGRVFDHFDCGEVGEVLVLALEDTPARFKQHLKKLLERKAWPKRATVYCKWPRADKGGLDKLRKWLQEHPKASLVIIDTFAKIRGRRRPGDQTSFYQDDYDAIGELKAIADDFRIGLVLVHHLRKMTGEDSFDEISGSTGLSGGADTLLVLKRPFIEQDGTLEITGRGIPEQRLAVRFDKDGDQTWTVVGDVADVRRVNPQRQDILDAIKRLGAATPAQLAKALHKDANNVRQLVYWMRQCGELNRRSDGKYELPTETLPTTTNTDNGSVGSNEDNSGNTDGGTVIRVMRNSHSLAPKPQLRLRNRGQSNKETV